MPLEKWSKGKDAVTMRMPNKIKTYKRRETKQQPSRYIRTKQDTSIRQVGDGQKPMKSKQRQSRNRQATKHEHCRNKARMKQSRNRHRIGNDQKQRIANQPVPYARKLTENDAGHDA